MEVRNLRLCDLDFGRKQLKVVQGKGKKDRYLPLSEHLIRGLKKYIEAEKPEDYLFLENLVEGVLVAISIPVTPSAAFSGR